MRAAMIAAGVMVSLACGTLPNGRRWGQDATIAPGTDRLLTAVHDAAVDPFTWVPLAGAGVLFVGKDWDENLQEWAVDKTPVFGSTEDADSAGHDLRQLMEEAHDAPEYEDDFIACLHGEYLGIETQTPALKAMTDLRKAIGEEIGKLSDTTRQIAAAVAAALFAGIALIAARLVIESPDPIVKAASAVIGVVLFLYVAAVVGSGIQYVRLQRRLRAEWHAKIYRFIPDEDYKRMVTQPAASAELGFAIAAWIGAGAAALLLILVLVATFSDFPPHSGAREARAAVQPVEPALGPNRAAGSPPEKHTASASDKAGDLTYSQNPNRGEGRPEANLSIHVDTSGSTGKAQDAPAKSQVAAGPERGAR